MIASLLLASAAFAAPPVAETELSAMRGGFSLPGGLDVAMAVQTETSLNGNLLLRSVYRIDQGPPSLQLYAPRAGDTVRGTQALAGRTDSAAQGAVHINFDRQSGVSIARQWGAPAGAVNVATGPATQDAPADDLAPLDLSRGPVETSGGRVSVSALPSGVRSRIEGDGIDASHLFGQAFGSIVANTANGREVDSVTSIQLDVRGATPMNLGSAMLRAEAVTADAVRQLVTR